MMMQNISYSATVQLGRFRRIHLKTQNSNLGAKVCVKNSLRFKVIVAIIPGGFALRNIV